MALKILIAATAAAALASAAPANACWNAEGLAAARLAEFNAAMMVTTLRCSLISIDMKANYEGFIVNHKKRLQSADDRLKDYFKQDAGGEKAYHQFYTQIGNRYGAARTDSAQCALFSAVAAELSRSASEDAALEKYAVALVPNPSVTGDRCAVLASRP